MARTVDEEIGIRMCASEEDAHVDTGEGGARPDAAYRYPHRFGPVNDHRRRAATGVHWRTQQCQLVAPFEPQSYA